MADMNRVFLVGNLTRNPEVRYAPSGNAVSDLGLAVSRKYRGKDGQEREETCFVRVTVWGKTAENCDKYLSKGSPVLIEGRLKYDEWEKDGQKHNRLSVVAERVQFLGAPRNAQYGSGAGGDDDGQRPARSSGGYGQRPAPASRPAPPPADDGGAGEPPPEMPEGGDEDNLPF